jgi:hypothetical protein
MIQFRLVVSGIIVMSTLMILSLFPTIVKAETIGSVTAEATPSKNFNGPCPNQIKFTGKIEILKIPMSGNYHWERSNDGKTWEKMEKKPIHVKQGQHTKTLTVLDYWHIKKNDQNRTFMERLYVGSGNTHITTEPVVYVCQ